VSAWPSAPDTAGSEPTGDLTFVTFDESLIGGVEGIDDVLALDAALKDLARVSPRQAEMASELRRIR